ncbi:MAG: zinc-dependent peptidase, partial [bacterium]|nr:zinc-dependent peptidase [bacterium]
KWRAFLHRHSIYYPRLSGKNRRRFERDIKIFLSELRIEGKYAACATGEVLYLTDKNLELSFADPRDKYNNIFHEIAHYLDHEDGSMFRPADAAVRYRY